MRNWRRAPHDRRHDHAYWTRDQSAERPTPEQLRISRIAGLCSRARYPGWQFSVPISGQAALIAFRIHPETGAMQKLGPWPLPEDAGEDEVRAACLAAFVATDGPAAGDRFSWLPGKG